MLRCTTLQIRHRQSGKMSFFAQQLVNILTGVKKSVETLKKERYSEHKLTFFNNATMMYGVPTLKTRNRNMWNLIWLERW